MKRMRLAGIVTVCALIPLLAPTVLVVLASLSQGELLTFPPKGFTIHWYSEMFTNPAVWTALGNSLFVAGVSVGINIICGVPAAIALPKVGRCSRTLFTVLLSLGLSSPTIVTAFAYFDLYGRIGVRGSLTAVAVAVAVTCFPFMLWTVLAAVEDRDPNVGPRHRNPRRRSGRAVPVRASAPARAGNRDGRAGRLRLRSHRFRGQPGADLDRRPDAAGVRLLGSARRDIAALGAVSAFFIAVVALAFAVVLRLGKVERFLFRT